jgi:hypothetical protein
MSKKIQISIPKPCHEDWDKMTRVEKGKFCSSCQKHVTDFSRMTDRELAQFFKKPSREAICGRFTEEQLERDIPTLQKRIPWVKYFFQFLLPAFLFSMKTTAQGKIWVKSTEKSARSTGDLAPNDISKACNTVTGDTIAVLVPAHKVLVIGQVQNITGIEISGRVTNELKEAVPYASIQLDHHFIASADSNGFYKCLLAPGIRKHSLQFSSAGYKTSDIEVEMNYVNVDRDVVLTADDLLPPVVVQATAPRILMGALISGVTIRGENEFTRQIKKEPVMFSIYPNPVKSGSALHIEWKGKAAGHHLLQLFSVSGQLIFSKEMYIDEEARLLSIDLPEVNTGQYFLRISRTKDGESFSEKLIVD